MKSVHPIVLKGLAMLAVIALLAACATIDLETNFVLDELTHNAIMDQNRDKYPDIDPLYINDEVKQLIDSIIRPRDSEEVRVNKLQDLLYEEEHLYVQYSDVKTHTAMEAFYARKGNCLSMMNLYIAMARYVGVDANFQTVDVQPSWDRRGGLLVLSQHINATGQFNFRRRYVVDFTPEITLQQLTSSIVSDLEARSLFFNNLGVEALVEEDRIQALAYFKNALFLDSDSSIVWNNIGAAYSQLGNQEFAEYSYGVAFNNDRRNVSAISNLAKFYRRNGDIGTAEEYEKAIERFNNKNPYYHYMQGTLAVVDNDFETARRAFRKALRLKQFEPDFHFALSRVYIELGDVKRALSFNDSGNEIVAQNDEIYRPSSQKVRIIDKGSILRSSSPGFSIILPTGSRN